MNKFSQLKVGEVACFEKTVTDEELIKFADLSGDRNALHLDDEFAVTAGFPGRVIHGFFLGALVSRLVGMYLPGQGALILKETLEFKKPALLGDCLSVSAQIMHKSEATRLLELLILIRRGEDILVTGSVHVRLI